MESTPQRYFLLYKASEEEAITGRMDFLSTSWVIRGRGTELLGIVQIEKHSFDAAVH